MHGGRRQRCHRWVPFKVIPCCESGKPPCSTFVASANLSLKLISDHRGDICDRTGDICERGGDICDRSGVRFYMRSDHNSIVITFTLTQISFIIIVQG